MTILFLEIPGLKANYSLFRSILDPLTAPISAEPLVLQLADDATGTEFLAEYNRLVGLIEKQVFDRSMRVGIWLPFSPKWLLSPVHETNAPESLCSMLILSFPEVHWMPIFSDQGDSRSNLHSIFHHACHLKYGHDPLMDGDGIRNHIRRLIPEEIKISTREGVAVAIDEELDCALTHAYTAYRSGFCARSVTSYGLMEYLFRSPEDPIGFKTISGTNMKYILLEDVGLGFADHKPVNFSNITARHNSLKGLNRADHVFLISSLSDGDKGSENTKKYGDSSDKVKWVSKPISGIFDLWKKIGPEGHHWAPIVEKNRNALETPHSAPGRLLQISDVLIARAERLLESAQSVRVAIHGAVLSSDAFELLGGLTPTTSLKALTLLHQFEVLVECNSHGVANNFDVKSRLEEFSRHTRIVTNAYPVPKRESARLNAEITVVGRLITEFRRHYQFDEENVCLNQARRIHQLKDAHERPCLIRQLSMRYANFLVESPRNFGLSIFANVLIIALAFAIFGYNANTGVSFDALCKNAQAGILTFLSLQAPDGYELGSGYISILVPAILSGLFHFGVFISYIYALMDRR